MENIKLGYLGKHNDTSIYLNMGKYGFYLNYDEKLYSVPACFQDKKFNLETAVKIIDYKSKLASEQKKLEMDSSKDDIMTKINAATDIIDLKNIVQDIKNKKSLKKTSNE
jgi:topoisomerase IA-like protein